MDFVWKIRSLWLPLEVIEGLERMINKKAFYHLPITPPGLKSDFTFGAANTGDIWNGHPYEGFMAKS